MHPSRFYAHQKFQMILRISFQYSIIFESNDILTKIEIRTNNNFIFFLHNWKKFTNIILANAIIQDITKAVNVESLVIMYKISKTQIIDDKWLGMLWTVITSNLGLHSKIMSSVNSRRRKIERWQTALKTSNILKRKWNVRFQFEVPFNVKKLIFFYKNTLFIFYSIFQYESRAVHRYVYTSIYTSIYMPIYFICIQYRHKNIVWKTS